MSKLVVIAVLLLTAVAAADAFRHSAHERTLPSHALQVAPLIVHRASSNFLAVGSVTRKTVLRNGREYLSEEAVDSAFPSSLQDMPFDIAYVAEAPDGTVALAVYKFPEIGAAQAALQLWRHGRLVSFFRVPSGAFAGGLGFDEDGRLVATVSSDGLVVHLFTRDGKPAGRQPATSW